MTNPTFSVRYAVAMADGGRCPIESGAIGRLADHECRHGRLAFDPTPACGCWPEEGAALLAPPRTGPQSSAASACPAALRLRGA